MIFHLIVRQREFITIQNNILKLPKKDLLVLMHVPFHLMGRIVVALILVKFISMSLSLSAFGLSLQLLF